MFPEPLSITRDQVRAAATVLDQLANAGVPTISRDEMLRAFAEAGLAPRQPAAPTILPKSPPEPPRSEEPPAAAPEGVPQARGPPAGCDQVWIRPREGARIAGVGLSLFYQWVRDGRVASRRVGGVRLIEVESIRRIAGDPVPTSRPGPRACQPAREKRENEKG
jgi:hypothetical protein